MTTEVPTDGPHARLSSIRKWSDFNGYGFNLHAEKGKAGQFIGKVDEGSPAAYAGLRKDDRIVEVNGQNIANQNHGQVVELIRRSGSGDEVQLLVVDRAADEYYIKRNMVVRSDMTAVVDKYVTPFPRPGKHCGRIGLYIVGHCCIRVFCIFIGRQLIYVSLISGVKSFKLIYFQMHVFDRTGRK
jgi:membrane-associated protease RseP (regulator of RpoE activity)